MPTVVPRLYSAGQCSKGCTASPGHQNGDPYPFLRGPQVPSSGELPTNRHAPAYRPVKQTKRAYAGNPNSPRRGGGEKGKKAVGVCVVATGDDQSLRNMNWSSISSREIWKPWKTNEIVVKGGNGSGMALVLTVSPPPKRGQNPTCSIPTNYDISYSYQSPLLRLKSHQTRGKVLEMSLQV